MEISIPVYVDYDCEYNDHFYEMDEKKFCPRHDNSYFYHDDIIKLQLVNFLELYGESIFSETKVRSFTIAVNLTEEQIKYLSLKYDNFLKICKEVKNDCNENT